ncbi:bile acid:Na+ symporter, BASS family [Chryseolinea serpens]|uniref:Bile acid:Na+ symporter, BASS family n=1 Tax=Chryseolinea serpens TaxID=947013 RepID=A0A1M5TIM2_9BACT|nr:bile acid:sodium symporter family protein [Chryseolinea serpens]SHH50544.1 bile acid:Na+ symporter, BASS family [Chryseolinea serpens]
MHPETPSINFSEGSITLMNICLAFIMLSTALEIKREHFTQLLSQRKAVITGLLGQYVLLPLVTVIVVTLLPVSHGVGLGLIMVSSCPGGSVSNFFSLHARGNVALAVALTGFSSMFAFVMTPLNFFFWSSLVPSLHSDVKELHVDFWSLTSKMLLVLLLPLVTSMFVAEKWPAIAKRVAKPARIISIIILTMFVVMAFLNNKSILIDTFHRIFWIVLLTNGCGLVCAYFFSKVLKNDEAVNRTVAIETSVHNSGLGLILIFSFFGGNVEMALVAAWWGIWHLVSGFGFASFMRNRPLPAPTT